MEHINPKRLLREAARSKLLIEFDIYDVAAAKSIEEQTGYPAEIILSEGWFTDKIKKVGEFLKKSVSEPAKYGWSKYAYELYGQQTYKWWKRAELRKAAEEQFDENSKGEIIEYGVSLNWAIIKYLNR